MKSKLDQLRGLNNRWFIFFSVIAIVMILLIVVGTCYKRYYNNHNLQASKLYVQLLDRANKRDIDGARLYAEQIVNDYPKTTYAGFANLWIAKVEVENNNYQKAKSALLLNQKYYLIPELKNISCFRLIRILLEEGDLKEARKYLDILSSGEKRAENYELWGDYFVKENDFPKAFDNYQKAKKLYLDTTGKVPAVLLLKLRNF